MAATTLNNKDNINIAHAISLWFQQDWSGNFLELGDCVIDGVTPAPEFYEFNSYRNGRNSLRKRPLVRNAATINATLNEVHVKNLQRVLFGGTIASSQAATAYDARTLTVASDGSGLYVDFTDLGEPTLGNVTITAIYEETDVLEGDSASISNTAPGTDDKVWFTNTTATSIASGDTVYVKYTYAYTGLYSTALFGATNSTIEGAVQLQARNTRGGITQLWDIMSASLSPNGDIAYPMDTIQTIPITLTLQERAGSWGTLYVG